MSQTRIRLTIDPGANETDSSVEYLGVQQGEIQESILHEHEMRADPTGSALRYLPLLR